MTGSISPLAPRAPGPRFDGQRRRFLRTLGGAAAGGLFAPLMRSAAAQSAGEIPRRFVIVMTGNGITGDTLYAPSVSAARANAGPGLLEVAEGLAEAPILGALTGSGGALDLTSESVAVHGLSSIIAGGSHTCLFKALAASNKRQQTIDAWLEARLKTDATPFGGVRLGNQGGSGGLQYDICLRDARAQIPIITSVKAGYEYLFGSTSGGRAFEQRGQLLDFALADVRAAQRAFVGNSAERAKLDAYLSALEQTESLRSRLLGMNARLVQLQTQYGLDAATAADRAGDHPMDRFDHQMELATAALTGGLTNLAVVTNAVGWAFGSIRYTGLRDVFGLGAGDTVPTRHTVCHGNSDPTYKAVLDQVLRRCVEGIARLARTLASVPEGNGTMLDHTVILFMADNGDTHHSSARNWPMLMMGGRALGARTGGRTLVYPGFGSSGHLRVANMMNTLGYLAGYPLDDFGGEPERLRVNEGGPLSELLQTG